MAAFGTTYYLIDDYQVSTTFGAGSGTGQQLTPEFQAGSQADAIVVAQTFATMFNRTVRLVQKTGSSPPWTLSYSPNTACRTIPSNMPPSITF